jgi:CRP/FNR family transcriptional regulator
MDPLHSHRRSGCGIASPDLTLFIIVSVRIRVVQQIERGKERELGEFASGAVLGEMSVIDDVPHSATAVAVEPTKAMVLSVWDFRAVVRENPEIGLNISAVLARRLRAAESFQ